MASLEVDDLIVEIDRILSPCVLPDRPVPAFLFGAEGDGVPAVTADLFHQGLVSHVFCLAKRGAFSDPNDLRTEAERFHHSLVQREVPESSISAEPRCTNTAEEAEQCVDFVRDHGYDGNEVLLIARRLHMLRAGQTFRAYQPSLDSYSAPGRAPGPPWAETDRMVQELARLKVYGERGWLVPLRLADDQADVVTRFLSHHRDRYEGLLSTL